jgi:hypothetical protein
MINIEQQKFLIGCAIGDGCISKSKRSESTTLHIQRQYAHVEYAQWQLEQLNSILGTHAQLKYFKDKGIYPAVRFGVTSKKFLTPIYNLLYPQGKKTLSVEVLQNLGLKELALFWMDDGSLEVRKRIKPSGSVKIERVGWLAVCEDEPTTDIVGSWIHDLTGSTYTKVCHKTGKFYLKWNTKQLKMLLSSIDEYVLPSLKYKTDLSRTEKVSDVIRLYNSNKNREITIASRVPRTQSPWDG